MQCSVTILNYKNRVYVFGLIWVGLELKKHGGQLVVAIFYGGVDGGLASLR